MAYDLKYGVVNISKIDTDEPVVVFRAQDKLLPKVLAYYHMFCLQENCIDEHLSAILESRNAVIAWQNVNWNRVKVPDTQ